MQSLGSGAARPRHTDILTAFACNTPLPQIITTLNLSPEDLHTFLTTPGIPDRLQALRALARFDQDLRTIQAQNEATEFLRGFLKVEAHKPEEKRRAATALLRGPGTAPARSAKNPDRQGGARPPTKPDIADWSPPDPTLDTEDDADLDEDAEAVEDTGDTDSAPSRPLPAASAGRGVGGPSENKPTTERSEREPAPEPILRLHAGATPDQVVERQLARIRSIDKPSPTPRDIYAAIDYYNLSFYNRYYAAKAIAFEQALIGNPILDVAGAHVTAEPAVIHDTTPPTATVRVTIKRSPQPGPADAQCPMPDASSSSVLFHLAHESTYFVNPDSPHAWHTTAITRDDSG